MHGYLSIFPPYTSSSLPHFLHPPSDLLHIPVPLIIQPLIRLQIQNPPIPHLDPLRPDKNPVPSLTFKVPLSVQRAVVGALGLVEGDADPGDLGLRWFGSGVRVGVGGGRRRGLGLGSGGEGPNVKDCAAAGCILFGGVRGGYGGGRRGWEEDAAFMKGDAWLVVVVRSVFLIDNVLLELALLRILQMREV